MYKIQKKFITVQLLFAAIITPLGYPCYAMNIISSYPCKDFILKNFYWAKQDINLVKKERKGNIIVFPTIDGKSGSAYYVASKKPGNKALFLFHEWWGLNEYILREADRFSDELSDMHIYAIDLYDSAVATTREEASKLMSGLKQERAEAIIRGILEYVGKDMRIATLGWCLGGGWSLQASIIAQRQSRACVMYYGMPEKNSNRLQALTAPVLFIAAEKDAWITQDVVMNFAQAMSDLKKTVSVINYEADHAFANPSNPHYDKEKADDAFRQAIDFIKMHF